MKKYVWLNIETGKFSNSWNEEEHDKFFTGKELEEHHKKNPTWKLISYECLTDVNFEFVHHMTIK